MRSARLLLAARRPAEKSPFLGWPRDSGVSCRGVVCSHAANNPWQETTSAARNSLIFSPGLFAGSCVQTTHKSGANNPKSGKEFQVVCHFGFLPSGKQPIWQTTSRLFAGKKPLAVEVFCPMSCLPAGKQPKMTNNLEFLVAF